MASKIVRVELGPTGNVIRIFRDKSWRLLPEDCVKEMTKAEAVGAIRKQVFERTRNDDGEMECERCGRYINELIGEMNEIRPKGAGGGKTGGEVSLYNCEALCYDCHQGDVTSAHGDRRWQTAKVQHG